ncbi:MAG: Rrf2 family transcriptional regulator [bacterium]
MKISTRGRYALRLMMDIAKCNREKPLQLSGISERQGISKRYLDNIAVSLRNNMLVRSVSGKNGGYMLSRPPAEIKIGEIIEAAIGPINVVECVIDPKLCIKSEFCECRPLYNLVNQRIREALNEFTLADITDKKICEDIAASLSGAKPSPTAQNLCSSKSRGDSEKD